MSALVLLFLFPFSLFAQQAPALGETLEISIVNVDVFVTDREGNRVHGLTQDDFEIYENGKRQPISNFAEYSGNTTNATVGVNAPAPAAAESAPRERRTILLFFEQTHLPQWAAAKVIGSMKETVRRIVEPGDMVSIVLWSRNGIVHTEFTEDLRIVEGALDRVGRHALHAEVDVAEQQREELQAVLAFEDGIAAMSSRLPASLPGQAPDTGAGSGAPLPVQATDTAAVNLYMMMAYNEMQVRVAAINSAINSMTGYDGKKILVLATKRLGEVAGAEFAYRAGVTLLQDQLKHRFTTAHLIDSIIANANAGDVTIYPVNLPGLEIPADAAEHLTLINETVSLENVARKTGGLMAAGGVDIARLLPRIAEDASDYYSLAYRIPASGGDLTRNIEVKTRNRAYTVRARRQFVEKSEDTRMRDRLRATLFRADPAADVTITATAGARKKAGRHVTVPVSVKIPISGLTVLPQGEGKHAGKFSVYIATAADLDELSDVTQKSQPFEIADERLGEAKAGHFTYDVDVKVGDKTRYLAVGVLDEVGRSYGLTRLDLKGEQKVQ